MSCFHHSYRPQVSDNAKRKATSTWQAYIAVTSRGSQGRPCLKSMASNYHAAGMKSDHKLVSLVKAANIAKRMIQKKHGVSAFGKNSRLVRKESCKE
eukprot:181143-Amphidinium_carterae.1